MNKLSATLLFLFIANLSIFGQSTKWDAIDDDGFSIQYPVTWDLNRSGEMGTKFIVFSPLSSSTDEFRDNVNLITQDLTGYNVDLNQYVEISEGQIESLITDGKMISSKRIKSDDTEFHKVIYTGKQGKFNLRFEQYYWVQNSTAYILTWTCEVKEFDKLKSIGEQVLNSFKIKQQ